MGKTERVIRAVLAAGLGLALLLTLLLGLRLAGSALYWIRHEDQPIEAWMTVGMVSRAYEVPRAALMTAVGLSPDARDRRPLSQIADESGLSYAELRTRLEAAIAEARAAGAPPDPEPSP